jgi:hypothetical protein
MPVQPPPVAGNEQRPFSALADVQVDRAGGPRRERDGNDLAALAGDDQGAVPAFQAKVLDVGAGCLRYPQPVEREQGDQRMLSRRPEPGGDKEGAELVAVQRGDVRLVVQPGAADVRGRGVLEEFFFDGVLVEPGDGAQPAGDGGAGAALGLEVEGVGLDVGSRAKVQAIREQIYYGWEKPLAGAPFAGKYERDGWWSEAAAELVLSNRFAASRWQLARDHVWPVSGVVHELLAKPRTREETAALLTERLVTCTLLTEEHARLRGEDGWARYTRAEIPRRKGLHITATS